MESRKEVLEMIRKRNSYKFWQQLHDFLMTNPKVPDVMWRVHNILDSYRAFGSRTNADYSAESLKLLLEDLGVDE